MNRILSVSATLALSALCLIAAPGDGIRLGEVAILSPFAGGKLGYDDNVGLTKTDKVDDRFYELMGGFDLEGSGEWGAVALRAWYIDRAYDDSSTSDSDGLQQLLELTLGSPEKVQLILNQSYEWASDNLHESAAAGLQPLSVADLGGDMITAGATIGLKRESQDFRVGLLRDFNKLTAGIYGGYNNTIYPDQNGSDWDQISALADVAYPIGPKTDLAVEGEWQQQSSDTLADDMQVGSARIGLHVTVLNKTDIEAMVGYRASESTGNASNGSLDQDGIDYRLSALWRISGRIGMQASAGSNFLPAELYADNTRRVDQATAGFTFDIARSFDAAVSASFRNDDYTQPVSGVATPYQQTGTTTASVAYRPGRGFLAIVGTIAYDIFESNFSEDYDRTTGTLAASLQY